MRLIISQEIELSEEQEEWTDNELEEFGRYLVGTGAVNADTVSVDIEVEEVKVVLIIIMMVTYFVHKITDDNDKYSM